MAPRGSIISGAKGIPGSSRQSPMGRGLTNPSIGGLSPLSSQLDTGDVGTWTNAYRATMPRPARDFVNGAFGPFSPIDPVPVDAPPEGSDFAEPRLFQYEVGWNLPVGQPGSEGIKLADFNTLRTLADLYSVARAAIQLRKSEVRGVEWDIMPTKEASKNMRGDHKAMRDFGERRAEAIKFFRKPDPDYFDWGSWLDALLEEVLVFDALSVVFRPKWGRGMGKGLLGSDLDSLCLINGPTVRPLLDMHGAKPRPPAPAYQQYLYGVPRTDIPTLMTQRDLDMAGLRGNEAGKPLQSDQMLYLPMTPRRWTPYGFPPIERALVPVMSGLQKQGYQLDYFREGTVPAVYISPGGINSNMTPNQIRELQDALNAIAGDPAYKHKIIVLPADSKITPQRQPQIADQFDEVVMNQVCMAFDVQPAELGILPKVATTTSPGAASQMAKASQDIHQRKATKPLLTFLASIMNEVLQNVCKQDDMRFVFEGLEETEDEATKTKTIVAQVSAGLRSIDEGREELQLQPWGLPETSDPGWATPGGGFIPLVEATQARQTGYAEGPVLALEPGKETPQQPVTPAPQAPKPPTQQTGAPPAPGTRRPNTASKPGATATPQATANAPRAPGTKRPKPAPTSGPGAASPGHAGASGTSSSRSTKQYDEGRTRAVFHELESLTRHVCKGRLISSWEPRHVGNDSLARVAENMARGLTIQEAITVLKRQRVVSINGQEYWTDVEPAPEVPAGSGGPFLHPHDAEDIYHVELDLTGSEPEPRVATAPDDEDDADMPGPRSVPPSFRGQPQPYAAGWPQGGHGTGQSPVTAVPGSRKGASDLGDPNPVDAEHVMNQLRKNYPEKALTWMWDARWVGPVEVPLDRIDLDDVDSWAASHEPKRVAHFVSEIKAGRGHTHPVVAVQEPGDDKVKVIDGHHRTLAYQKLDRPIVAYVGFVDSDGGPWDETHSSQTHQRTDPQNKTATHKKVSKVSVNYRPATNDHRCGTCSMFIKPGSCTLVVGKIKSTDTCDEWEPRSD